MTPMLQLGTMLHSKGFSIIVAHSELNAPNPLGHPEFVFLRLEDNLSDADTSFTNLLNIVRAINKRCESLLVHPLSEMMKDEELHGRISCFIFDSSMQCGELVATQLKIPSLIFHTGCAAHILAYHSINLLQAQNYFPIPVSRLKEPVPGQPALRFKDLPVSVSSKIPEYIQYLFSLDVKSSMGIIWNTTEDLEPSSLNQLHEHYKVPFFTLGPFHEMAPSSSTSFMKEDTTCISWLNKQAPNSVLYISLGSMATIGETELHEMAWGLANTGQPFLLVIRDSVVTGSQRLPERLKKIVGEKGIVVEWAPQKEVLKHSAVGGFWTHCGWNSTLESTSEGIPMICRPCFVDQMVNSRYITHIWKVGLELEDYNDRVVIERAVRKLMVDDEGREMQRRALDLKGKLEAGVQEEEGSSRMALTNLADFIYSSSKITLKG